MTLDRRLGALPLEIRLGLAAGVVAVVWAIVVLQPWGAATIDPDASASVLYFDRIVSGHRLEAFVPTTPKPLLTFVYGITWAIGHDWQWLVWETIAAWGLAVGATAALVARLSGRAGAQSQRESWLQQASGAAFGTAALLGSSGLMLEVSRANSLVWALAGWSIAGLGATATPRRPVLAGVALLLAGLCRFETLALAALAFLAVAAWRRRAVSGPEPRLVPGFVETADQFARRGAAVRARTETEVRATMVGALLAVASVPIVLIHDWLLSGDPLYWLSVPSRYTAIYNAGLVSIDPLSYAGTIVGRLAPEWPLILLAAVGVVVLFRSRQWLPLAGIAAIGLGVLGLLFWLALRATYISNRYYEPIDLALTAAAAVGVGWLVSRVPIDRPAAIPAAAAAAAAIGIVVVWPALPWDRRATAELSDVRRASEHLATVRPALADALELGAAQLVVPSRDVSRLAVEADLRLGTVLDSYALLLRGGTDALMTGQVVFHDAAADRPVALYRPLEIDDQAILGANPVVRLNPGVPEIWLLSVRP